MSAEMWTGLAPEIEAASERATTEMLERVYRAVWPDNGRAWWKAGWRYAQHSAFTDAVLALIAETLPGWGVGVVMPGGDCEEGAVLSADLWWGSTLIETEAATPALALLAALCRAKAAQAEAGGLHGR